MNNMYIVIINTFHDYTVEDRIATITVCPTLERAIEVKNMVEKHSQKECLIYQLKDQS